MKDYPEVSISIATRNQHNVLKECIDSLLDQDYPKGRYEIVVVDDESTDDTPKLLESYGNRIRWEVLHHSGAVVVRNNGIGMAKFQYVITLNGDCVPEKNWLKNLMKEFTDEKIAAVGSWSRTGGMSTAYKKDVLMEVGMFDPAYKDATGYRDDTDLVFRILDRGYRYVYTPDAKFEHRHVGPADFWGKIKYAINRVRFHEVDPLLYKKHPERTKEFLDIKLGFIRNPIKDFQVATGTWAKGRKLSLSSPQGIVLIEKKSPLHAIVIVVGGIIYVVVVKFMRLYGSIKYRKLLI